MHQNVKVELEEVLKHLRFACTEMLGFEKISDAEHWFIYTAHPEIVNIINRFIKKSQS